MSNVAASDDGVVTIDDDTGEASMMKMMGFSDFNSTKASLHNELLTVKVTASTAKLFLSCCLLCGV